MNGCQRGDIVRYQYNDKQCRGLFLGYLHTGRAVICHTVGNGEHIPLVLDTVTRVVKNEGYMPEYAPAWAACWGKQVRRHA